VQALPAPEHQAKAAVLSVGHGSANWYARPGPLRYDERIITVTELSRQRHREMSLGFFNESTGE